MSKIVTAADLANSLVAGYPCNKEYLEILENERSRIVGIQIHCGFSPLSSSKNLEECTAAILAHILSNKDDLELCEQEIARVISVKIAKEGPTEEILNESHRLVVLVCVSPNSEIEREESLSIAVWIARFLRTAYKNKTGKEYVLY